MASDNFVNAKAFVAASINPAQIVYGIGKTAGISFTMDPNDANYNSRTMTVTLNGLTHPNAVTNADGTVTLSVQPSGNRVVTVNGFTTTTEDKEVSFTVEEESYAPITASASRRRGRFSNMSFSEKQLGVTVGEPVTFNFTLSDYEPGMKVNVELDGLEPSDGDLSSSETRATVTNWIYEPNGTSCSFDLKTIIAAENTCRVRLSANGYDSSEWVEIEQQDKKTGTIPKNRTVKGTLSNVPNNTNAQNNCTATISIDGNDNIEASCNVTKQWNTYSYTITISNAATVRYTDGQKAKIRVRFRNNSQNYYSGTCDVADLINGNLNNIVLTRE